MIGKGRYQSHSAVIDTNLVLLLLVARVDQTLLLRYKRVQMFTNRDISLLHQVLKSFREICTTPNVLTEVSNFLGQAPTYAQTPLKKEFAVYIESKKEIYTPSADLVVRQSFFNFGLTDCTLEDASAEHTVITTDHRLAGKIQKMGRRAINFNHARTSYLLT